MLVELLCFFKFELLRIFRVQIVQAETQREVGVDNGVSYKQIRLKIFSPNVLNITLVDLPGITKIPVGEQPYDIEAQIRIMILSYIKHETCIILVVSPANADFSNCDALQMERIVDLDGKYICRVFMMVKRELSLVVSILTCVP